MTVLLIIKMYCQDCQPLPNNCTLFPFFIV